MKIVDVKAANHTPKKYGQLIQERTEYFGSFAAFINIKLGLNSNMQPTATSLPLWVQLLLAFVPAVGATFAGVGLWLNAAQSRISNAQTRATIVAKCLERFTDDEDMQAIYYSIEYSRFVYDQPNFHDSVEEKQLDKLLMHFSMTALSWKAGLLKTEDLQPLQYLVRSVIRNSGVTAYLNFVSEFSSRADLGEHPYISLSEMALALEA